MKRIFIGFALLVLYTAAQAQITIKPGVGINFTDFSKDPSTGNFQSKVGWQVGGSVAFGKKLYIEPGFFYGKKSTKYVDKNTSSDDVKFDISGIRIPVAIGYKLLGDEKSLVGLRAFGGGSAFILTSIKDLDKDDFKTASWGVFAGAGVDISIIFVDLQYEWSLSNISKDIDNIDVGKSRSFFVSAGVRIAL